MADEFFVVNPTMSGFAKALEYLEYSIRWDVRKEKYVYREGGSGPWLECHDRAMAYVNLAICERVHVMGPRGPVPWQIGKDKFYRLRDAHCLVNASDAFTEYLDGLPVHTLDPAAAADYGLGVDLLLSDVFGVEGTTYNRHLSRMLLLGAVARAYSPGYKLDEVLVLKGAQGVGKDAIITSLLPDADWSTTSLSFAMSHKEKIEVSRGKVIVVASEMSGVTTARDMEALKSYITATHDDVRLAYRRDAEAMPRRYVFACTTNLDKPLPEDATGNRRWCVVEVGPSEVGAVEPYVEKRRERLWAEAVALWKAGYRPNLPRDLKGHQLHANADLARHDEQLSDAYDVAINTGALEEKPQTMSEIAVAMLLVDSAQSFRQGSRQDQHRLRNELLNRGWVNRRGRRGDGPVRRLWFPPEEGTP